jgi:hypothetical protein
MEDVSIVGLDLAKRVFQDQNLHGRQSPVSGQHIH